MVRVELLLPFILVQAIVLNVLVDVDDGDDDDVSSCEVKPWGPLKPPQLASF